MTILENPVRERHWVLTQLPTAIAGIFNKYNITIIRFGSRKVGKDQNSNFHKRVKASIHFLRILLTTVFDIGSHMQEERAVTRLFKATYTKGGPIYQNSLSNILDKILNGKKWQTVLALSIWRVKNKTSPNKQMRWRT